MDVLSCDTMVALGNSTLNGHVIFAKNSDRPLGEAQPLVIYPAKDHEKDEVLHCTYIDIPQVQHTYRILGSKPDWIWGFEHGMNEYNVVIGNEAVWSKDEPETETGLLGMDLLRLGLERGGTAYEAMHIIIGLLEQYGQMASAARNKVSLYNNSFLIADSEEAWVLDTSNRRWVARRVRDVQGISNCYSTEEEWDEASEDLAEHAYQNGWISRKVPFNFAKAYSAMTRVQRFAQPRYFRSQKLLHQAKGAINIDTMRRIQRDHFDGELIAPRWSPADGLHESICKHALDPNSSKTAASAQIEITGASPIWWNCFSSPCVSVYLPVPIDADVPSLMSTGGRFYVEGSLWWAMERLCYEIDRDYPYYSSQWSKVKDVLEKEYGQLIEEQGTISSEELEKIAGNLYRKINSTYECFANDIHTSENPQRANMVAYCRKLTKME